jgi:hypothetical protein
VGASLVLGSILSESGFAMKARPVVWKKRSCSQIHATDFVTLDTLGSFVRRHNVPCHGLSITTNMQRDTGWKRALIAGRNQTLQNKASTMRYPHTRNSLTGMEVCYLMTQKTELHFTPTKVKLQCAWVQQIAMHEQFRRGVPIQPWVVCSKKLFL